MNTEILSTNPNITRLFKPLKPLIFSALFLFGWGWAIGVRSPALAGGAVRYVDGATGSDSSDCTNPTFPCSTIQYAIYQSGVGDKIRVAEGIYEGFGMNIPISILGGYEASSWTRDIAAHPTVVDGGGTWPGHLIHAQPGANLFLEGFTVQGAAPLHAGGGFGVFTATATISATIIQDNYAQDSGGGLYAHEGDVTIIHSTLQNNATNSGGAALGACCNSTITLENVDILSNTAQGGGGGILVYESFLLVSDSSFSNNLSGGYGGAINVNGAATGLIQDTLIVGNQSESGGGLALEAGGQATVLRSAIRQNLTFGGAGGGAGVWDGSILTMTHSILSDNTTFSQGGGIHVSGPSDRITIVSSLISGNQANEGGTGIGIDNWGATTLINSTVADNVCQTPLLCGGGVSSRTPDSLLTIVNSILAFNAETDLYCEGNCDVSYSDVIDTLWPGDGNLSADPWFVNSAGGDYHLQAGSPAADAGTPYNAPPDDLDGFPHDAFPDMGAYELARVDYDLAMTDLQPQGMIPAGAPTPIHFTLYNAGNNTFGSFSVLCEIEFQGSKYWGTTISWDGNTMPPLRWFSYHVLDLSFNNAGEYTLVCTSLLNDFPDERLQNNAITRILTVTPAFADAWVHDNLQDVGDVPSDEDNWYQSSDIWVRNADDGGLVHQDPIAGQMNYVYVRVHNRGNTPLDGSIDLTWIESSLGTRCGDWAPIGSITYTALLPGETRILSRPWTPTRSGHTCLQSILDSVDDPYNRDLECTPHWIPWDNNLGWRNINIFDNPASLSLSDIFTSSVDLVNVYNLPADVDLVVDRLTFPLNGEMIVELPQNLFDAWQANGAQGTGIEMVANTTQIRVTGTVSGTVAGIPMVAAQRELLTLQFSGPTGLDFEVGLRERINGLVVGGVGYQWRIPDTTPPTVVSATPAEGATGVDPVAAFIITFDEPVSPATFNLILDPLPSGNYTTIWNADNTVVTVTYDGLAYGTSYTANMMVSDASLNTMAAAYQWSFTTEFIRLFLSIIIR